MSKRVCKDDQIRLIMECRQSGLSDYQWCKQNDIHPGNFYNGVSRLILLQWLLNFLLVVSLCVSLTVLMKN